MCPRLVFHLLLPKNTEVSAAVRPDYGAASFPGLWGTSVHHQHNDNTFSLQPCNKVSDPICQPTVSVFDDLGWD